jgi:aspartyl-tRNA(Asn)/glutamyl-tRNA(Gln) amidotransferase subunit C
MLSYNNFMKIDVKHVAKLANLPLKPAEESKFEKQLSETLSYVEKLNSIDTKGIEPTSQVTGLENITRKDEAKPSLTQTESLSNAKSQHNGFFKVKAILEE